ncbi:DNA topoisomerase I, mitochondrial-like [Empidonax traillii]|uniref:DNA topoisomerase I, mitochondrial-like n=1 Tax=Empidonax traillii TaxID=164674 RepID=UPI000FFD6C67|nr:DNA topoisomerase I, mitochondrial-like [Empidonax traillii]
MGVSRDSEMKKSSRKRKKELENGQEVPKELRTKIGKKEPEYSVQFPAGKEGKGKKKPPKVKEKPLQENIISSSLKQEAAGGKGLGSSLGNGIQAEEGAALGSEETKASLPQGPPVELQDSSGCQDKSQEAGPAVGQQLLKIQNGIGIPKPSDGVAGGISSPSGDAGNVEMDVELADVREGEEKELDPPVPRKERDSRVLKSKKGGKKKQEEKKEQEKGLKRKRERKKDKFGDGMEGIEEEEDEGGSEGGRNWEEEQGRAKRGKSSRFQGQGDGREKQEKGKAKKHKKVKVEGVEKVGKKRIKKEKVSEEEKEQEVEKMEEEGAGSEREGKDEVGKGSGDGKGVKEEEELREEKLGETWRMGMEQEEEGKGDEPRKKKKSKKKKPEGEEKEEKKSQEEETPGKSRKRKTQEGGGEKSNKKAQKEEEKEAENKWKWWEEEKKDDGVKWTQLEHKGPYFAPLYEPLPEDVRFYYDGKPLKLSLATEEIATFYAKMLDHEYTSKEIFQNNFFHDWRKEMTSEEQEIIQDLAKCDFSEIHKYFVDKSEARKALPKEEKQKLKEEADKIQEEYGYCILDGHREKIGNFKTEPPGLFRGRGDHPKMGMLKKRIMPEDVVINCSKDSKIPKPPEGHKWKEVRFDNTVTWLASWTENIQNTLKYIMLNPSSKLKVFKNLQLFMKNKDPSDDLFDSLNTTFLNKHLQHLMDGLTAKVFRTYNASITLQEQLKALTNPEDNVAGKLLSYNRANRAVAVLCNHQRSVPKTFAKSMEILQTKIDAKKKQVEEAQQELQKAEEELEDTKDAKAEANVEKKKKLLKRLEEQLARLNVQATDKEENKQIALGTSKLNYLDPRISVAWCKKFGVPIEKIYNKTQREKFAWAIAMANEDFEF